jgi:hypothetical protein
VSEHPDVESSPEMVSVVEFLTNPPLSPGIKVGYMVLLEAAVATLPERLRGVLGVTPKPGAETVGKTAVATLRWALGYSPSWALALKRTDSDIPWELFRQVPEDRFDRAS